MIIIFDLDGTVLDTFELIRINFIETFKNYLPEYKYTENDLKSFFGPGLRDTFKSICCNEEKAEELIIKYQELTLDLQKKYLKSFPDSDYVLAKLKDYGFKLAIFSNKIHKAIVSGLEQMNLIQYFDLIIGIDEVDYPKPNPQGIYMVKEFLNDEKCIYVGDTKIDIETAINANIDAVGVSYALTKKEDLFKAGAKFVASSMKDLLKIMEKNYV